MTQTQSEPATAPTVGPAVPRRGHSLSRWLGRRLLAWLGLRMTGELPDEPRLMVIGAPHTSNWDGVMAIGLAMAYSLDVRVIAKASLFRWPFAGLLRWLGVIGIDRSAPGGVVGALIKRYRRSDQLWVCMSPEGTRAGTDTWKTGFHRIARAVDVPVLVLVFDWANGEIRAADTFRPTADYTADLTRILACFQGVSGRKPERLSAPLKAMANTPQEAGYASEVTETIEALAETLTEAPDQLR